MKIITLTAFIIGLASGQAMAGGTIGVGYAGGISPYKNYDDKHMVMPWVSYENDYVYLRGLSLGVKLYNQNSMEVSAYVAYDPQRFKSKDSNDGQLRRLDNRDAGFVAGGRLNIDNPVGIFSAALAGDISGNSGGFAGQVSYAKPFDFDPFNLTPEIGLYWGNEDYNDYYYGVSKKEAAVSGLKEYKADAAFSPFAALKADLSLDDEKRIGIYAQAEVIFLAPTIKDSPMVSRSTATGFTTGIRYSFR